MGMQPKYKASVPNAARVKMNKLKERMRISELEALAQGRHGGSYDRRGKYYRHNESHLNPDYDDYIRGPGNYWFNKEKERRRLGVQHKAMLGERMAKKQRLYGGGVQ